VLRGLWGILKRLFIKEYQPLFEAESNNRGLLRSVDKRLGYRKEKSQARNWKRKWRT
jgi:hypothetical protein